MSDSVQIVTVDGENVDEFGFFCYKSKPKSQGYKDKLAWLRQRFEEGLRIKILHENARSVGFIEYVPGEYTWRVVKAPGYLVVHCFWVVGRAKKRGYGSRLLEECVEDARRRGKLGVAVVTSRDNWLANEKVFLKNGFETVGAAPPAFGLLVKEIKPGPVPIFPQDWDKRLGYYGSGATIVYADQCPYMPNGVEYAVDQFAARGIEAKTVKLESSVEVRAKSPSAYGVFGIVFNGRLLSYHYLGKKELRRLDEDFLSQSKD
jgi:GNAT superfamily N-acetyltransferase